MDFSSSYPFFTVNPDCPAAANADYQALCVILIEKRFRSPRELVGCDMKKLEGKEFWDHVTELYNAKREHPVTRDRVLEMALATKEFHRLNTCDCVGSVFSEAVRVRGPPAFPDETECEEGKKTNGIMAAQPVCPNTGPSMMSETFSGKRPRMMTLVGHEGSCPKITTFESRFAKIQQMLTSYKVSGAMKHRVVELLTLNPSVIPIVLDLAEEGLIEWFRAVVQKDDFESWYARYTQ
ncbi:hypothetical protein C2S51_031679 [Perilla frutescens var. frutescens]|nr:hypothetical protein C2S51_031679 [Perilla frutescens var. frutescens]